MSQVYSSIVVSSHFLPPPFMTLRNCPARLLIVTCLVGRGPYSIYFLKCPTKPCCFRYDCVWPLPCFLDNNIHNIECDVSVFLFIFKIFLARASPHHTLRHLVSTDTLTIIRGETCPRQTRTQAREHSRTHAQLTSPNSSFPHSSFLFLNSSFRLS